MTTKKRKKQKQPQAKATAGMSNRKQRDGREEQPQA
jgi:hypothetical protein